MSADTSGYDIPRNIKQQAAQWLLDLQESGTAPELRTAWLRWRQADPRHELAWLKVAALSSELKQLPNAGLSRNILVPAQKHRRHVLGLLCLGLAGSAVWQFSRFPAGAGSHSTRVGERQDILLEDGTRLALNTDTQVRILFDATQRMIWLESGEILVDTAPDPRQPSRPFLVRTASGSMQALGTRFTVRYDTDTLLQVLEGAVEVRRTDAPDSAARVPAGMQMRFSASMQADQQAVPATAAAWQRGMLLAVDMPLPEFVAELSRYRSGRLECEPELASLRVSGTFPLNDTDTILRILENEFPIQLRRRTQYWIRVQARR